MPTAVRRAGLLVLGVAIVVVGTVLLGPASDGLPLDPRSADPDGLLGLVELLEDLDVEVAVSGRAPSDPATRVFVPAAQLPSARRDELRRFAEEGGTVVVAGQAPAIHDFTARDASALDAIGRTERLPECAALAGLGPVLHNAWASFEIPDGATSCFPVGEDGAWLVVVPTGQGSVVALGSARPFTNALLAEADNAVLAATLLGPAPRDRLVIVPRGEVGEGDTPLLDLVPPGFLRALWVLVAALLAAVSWRARRLGHPVEERLPPVLPSAELAHSVADLLQRAGDRGAAGGRIRDDTRREVRRALRVPPDTPTTRLVELVTARSGVATTDARLALLDGPVDDDAALTDLAAAASRVRTDLHRSSTPGAHPAGSTPGAHPAGSTPGAHPAGSTPGAHPASERSDP